MRRTIVVAASIVTVLVVVAGTVVAQTTRRFSDVPADHPAAEAIHWAADVGITTGWPDGTFRPEQPLHRSHAIIFMDRFYEQVLQATQSENFTRGDMMLLLHTIATAVPAATTTTTASHPRDSNHPNLRTALDAVIAEHPRTAELLSEIRYRESTPADRPCGRVFWLLRDSCLHPASWTVYDSNWDDPAAPYRFVFHIGMALYSEVQVLVYAMQEEGISDVYASEFNRFTQTMAADCDQVGPHACLPGSLWHTYAYAGDAFAASVFAPQYGLSETHTSRTLIGWLVDILAEAPCAEATQDVDGRVVSFRCTQRRN